MEVPRRNLAYKIKFNINYFEFNFIYKVIFIIL